MAANRPDFPKSAFACSGTEKTLVRASRTSCNCCPGIASLAFVCQLDLLSEMAFPGQHHAQNVMQGYDHTLTTITKVPTPDPFMTAAHGKYYMVCQDGMLTEVNQVLTD